MTAPGRALLIVTSHARLGDTGEETGVWLEELAAPYYVLQDEGWAVTIASPGGGQAPVDPRSLGDDMQTDATRRFLADQAATAAMAATVPADQVEAEDFAILFAAGGHGTMWDFPATPALTCLIEAFEAAGKPYAAVCHGPAVLTPARRADGTSVVQGRRVTAFTNTEEAAVGLTEAVPFLLESKLRALGGQFESAADFRPHVVVDGPLVTGQNPASSGLAAQALSRLYKAVSAPAS